MLYILPIFCNTPLWTHLMKTFSCPKCISNSENYKYKILMKVT